MHTQKGHLARREMEENGHNRMLLPWCGEADFNIHLSKKSMCALVNAIKCGSE